MKKIEIMQLIEANTIITKNNDLLSITRDSRFNNMPINKKHWFPHIEELKDDFEILSKEVQSAMDETEKWKKHIQNSNCSHEIRLKYNDPFGHSSKCIFCGKVAMSNNWANWSYSINRNKYCVDLLAKYQPYDEEYSYIPDGYTKEQVYAIIMNILKNKKDDEEIDLVQEFKKLNLPNCAINEEKKVNENYILIISGSNKQFIDDTSYIHKKGLKISFDFVQYFSSLLNTKVELIDNSETLESNSFRQYFPKENRYLNFVNYDSVEELEKILLKQKEIPFKLIIDLSELYKYKISEKSISKEPVSLKLDVYFPQSHIIRIGNLSNRNLEELFSYLKQVHNFTKLYAYQANKYYYLENNDLKSDNLDHTCEKAKRLLRK